MKILKNIFIGFLNLILINLLTLFVISLNLKNLITDGIIKETIKQQINTKEYQEQLPKEIIENEKINEILENKEINDLLEKYLDIAVDGMIDENKINEIALEKDILNYINENKSILEKELGTEITNEMLKKAEEQIDSKELSNIFKQSLSNTSRNIPKEVKTVIKGYNFLISSKFKTIIILFILIDLLLIAIINHSFYNWLKSLGISSIISGCGIILMSLSVNLLVTTLNELSYFNTNPLLINGCVLVGIGIFIIIIKVIIDKKIAKGEKNEISEISK